MNKIENNSGISKYNIDFSKFKIINVSYWEKDSNGKVFNPSWALYSKFKTNDSTGPIIEYQSILGIGISKIFPFSENIYLGMKGDVRFHWLAWQKEFNKNKYTPGIELIISMDTYLSGLELSYLKTFPSEEGYYSIDCFSIDYYWGLSGGFWSKKKSKIKKNTSNKSTYYPKSNDQNRSQDSNTRKPNTPTITNTPKVLDENKKRDIYYELVKLQDSGKFTHEINYNVIASRYNITIQQVKNIAAEGIMLDWDKP